MNRKIGSVMLSAVLAFTLAACGNSNNNTSSTESAGASKPADSAASTPVNNGKKTKIVYWTGDRHDMDYIKEVVQSFNDTNSDNIEVEMVVKTDDFDQAIDLAFASGQAPDVIRTKENTLNIYVTKGYLAPIDELLTDDMKSKFPIIPDFNQVKGKIYSLPNYGSTIRLVYNKDLFAKAGITAPPTTLAELVYAAKEITKVGKAEGAYGFAQNFKSPDSSLGRSARVIAEASGFGGFGYNFKTARYDFSGYKEIINAFKQMVDDGSALPGMESLDIDPLRAQFAEGKIGMYMSFSSEPGVYKNQFPAKIDWAAAPVPTIDGTVKGATSFLGGQWLAISSSTKNQEAAWKFIQYMYDDQVLKTYHEKGFGISMVPSISAIAQKPDINGIDGFLPVGNDGTWPLHPTVTVEGIKSNDAFFKYMLAGGNLDTIIEDMTTRYNAGLDKLIANGEFEGTPNPDFDPMKLMMK
jgi:multiple sugar transport system substrate-binding protein